jgi:hypothetical protein
MVFCFLVPLLCMGTDYRGDSPGFYLALERRKTPVPTQSAETSKHLRWQCYRAYGFLS